MKLEIKLDPEDIQEIKEIAQRLADILLDRASVLSMNRSKTLNPREKQLEEKVWKMPDGEWWSDKEVAKVIGIAVHTIRQWRFSGKGPTYQKIGRRVLYRRTAVLEFMNSFPKITRRD